MELRHIEVQYLDLVQAVSYGGAQMVKDVIN